MTEVRNEVSFPHVNSFVLGTVVINNNSFVLGTVVITTTPLYKVL
jgi:hypothetical protein